MTGRPVRAGRSGPGPTAADRCLVEGVGPWYRVHRRDLPWRGADPWSVLVSEVMLQQTPVTRVRPVYTEWLARWPTPAALAAAAPADALVAWGRLGYPRRARNLHRSAGILVDEHGGAVPDDPAVLRRLPGVGEYTARAVAVFGHGRRHGVVDVNVRRVLARFALGAAVAAPAAAHIALAEDLLPADEAEAATVSAGLMELGALVCRPGTPGCPACPLAPGCRWRAAGFPPGPARPRPAPYEGSDRQARGDLLSVLRAGHVLDDRAARRAVPDDARRARALTGLVADGLLVATGARWRLPLPGE